MLDVSCMSEFEEHVEVTSSSCASKHISASVSELELFSLSNSDSSMMWSFRASFAGSVLVTSA